MAPGKEGSKELSVLNKKTIFTLLYMGCQERDEKTPLSNQFVRVSEAFSVQPRTIRRVWRQIDANMEAHLVEQAESSPEFEFEAMEQLHDFWNRKLPIVIIPDHLFDSNKKGVVGRKKQFDRKALVELTVNASPNERGTYRSHAAALDISRSLSWKLVKQDDKSS